MRHVIVIFALLQQTPLGVAVEPSPYLGRASCASATCHGGVIDRGPVWNHSLSIGDTYDPHAGAGRLLRDPDSQRIVAALNAKAVDKNGNVNRDVYDTVLRKRCISCHATATSQQCDGDGTLDDMVLAEGVSCEACHGAAENWLDPHLQVGWAGPQRFEQETGMIDTESIVGRAEGCVRCHIGSRRADGLVRDMNHDLIAAGHPVLRYDLLLYNENLPKHWSADSDVEKNFNQSAIRVRSVSRAIGLAAAAALSGERATDHLADRNVPWPELSDYDCFACHQALSMAEYQLPASEKRRSPQQISDGLPMWNAWHTINQQQVGKESLRKLSPNLSDPKAVAPVAQSLSKKHRNIAAEQAAEHPDAGEARDAVVEQLIEAAPLDWHQAAIQYLDIDAALRDLARGESSSIKAAEFRLQVEPLLRFDGGDAQFDSPTMFNAEQFKQTVLSVLNRGSNAPPASNNQPSVLN